MVFATAVLAVVCYLGSVTRSTFESVADNTRLTLSARNQTTTRPVPAPVPLPPVEVTFTSNGKHDGRIWESSPKSGRGGRLDASDASGSAIRIGDLRGNLRYRSILSFDTSMLPDDARIVSAALRLKRGWVGGTNPFLTHGECYVDIRVGSFGRGPELEASDYGAPATSSRVGWLTAVDEDDPWSEILLGEAGLATINSLGITQFRIYFELEDGDNGYDYVGYYSGESQPENRPRLIIGFTRAQS